MPQMRAGSPAHTPLKSPHETVHKDVSIAGEGDRFSEYGPQAHIVLEEAGSTQVPVYTPSLPQAGYATPVPIYTSSPQASYETPVPIYTSSPQAGYASPVPVYTSSPPQAGWSPVCVLSPTPFSPPAAWPALTPSLINPIPQAGCTPLVPFTPNPMSVPQMGAGYYQVQPQPHFQFPLVAPTPVSPVPVNPQWLVAHQQQLDCLPQGFNMSPPVANYVQCPPVPGSFGQQAVNQQLTFQDDELMEFLKDKVIPKAWVCKVEEVYGRLDPAVVFGPLNDFDPTGLSPSQICEQNDRTLLAQSKQIPNVASRWNVPEARVQEILQNPSQMAYIKERLQELDSCLKEIDEQHQQDLNRLPRNYHKKGKNFKREKKRVMKNRKSTMEGDFLSQLNQVCGFPSNDVKFYRDLMSVKPTFTLDQYGIYKAIKGFYDEYVAKNDVELIGYEKTVQELRQQIAELALEQQKVETREVQQPESLIKALKKAQKGRNDRLKKIRNESEEFAQEKASEFEERYGGQQVPCSSRVILYLLACVLGDASIKLQQMINVQAQPGEFRAPMNECDYHRQLRWKKSKADREYKYDAPIQWGDGCKIKFMEDQKSVWKQHFRFCKEWDEGYHNQQPEDVAPEIRKKFTYVYKAKTESVDLPEAKRILEAEGVTMALINVPDNKTKNQLCVLFRVDGDDAGTIEKIKNAKVKNYERVVLSRDFIVSVEKGERSLFAEVIPHSHRPEDNQVDVSDKRVNINVSTIV